MKDDLPPKILLVLSFILVSMLGMKINSSEIIIEDQLVIVNGSYIQAIANPVTFENEVLGNISNCIKFGESSNGINNYNPDDIHRNLDGTYSVGSFGPYQFSKPTFQEFCIDRYKLTDEMADIMDGAISRECNIRMIIDGYGGRWTTFKRCI